MNWKERRKVEVLERRRDYLAARLEKYGILYDRGMPGDRMSYDRAEWDALSWAVERIKVFDRCAIEGKEGPKTAEDGEIKESP